MPKLELVLHTKTYDELSVALRAIADNIEEGVKTARGNGLFTDTKTIWPAFHHYRTTEVEGKVDVYSIRLPD